MIVGNDVVHLREHSISKHHLNTRFVDRIFTIEETERIHQHPSPNSFMWSLWAVKEAAYKAVIKIYPKIWIRLITNKYFKTIFFPFFCFGVKIYANNSCFFSKKFSPCRQRTPKMMANAQKQQENKGKTRFQGVRNEPRCSKTQGKQRVSSCQSTHFGSILGSLADRE